MRLSTLLALFGLLGSAQAATLEELLARMKARREAVDFRAGGRLVRVQESGLRQSRQFAMKGRAIGEILHLFCEVTAPPAERVRLLIESRGSGAMSIRIGRPGEASAKELPFAQWGQALLDTDFSYEDLLESHFLWKNQALAGEEKWGARSCYLIRSTPGPADRSHYASVTSWVDRETWFPIHVEKVTRAGGVTKEFLAYGLRQSKGIWSAGQIEAKTKGRGGSSFLIITRGAGKAEIKPRDFDPTLLVKP